MKIKGVYFNKFRVIQKILMCGGRDGGEEQTTKGVIRPSLVTQVPKFQSQDPSYRILLPCPLGSVTTIPLTLPDPSQTIPGLLMNPFSPD